MQELPITSSNLAMLTNTKTSHETSADYPQKEQQSVQYTISSSNE